MKRTQKLLKRALPAGLALTGVAVAGANVLGGSNTSENQLGPEHKGITSVTLHDGANVREMVSERPGNTKRQLGALAFQVELSDAFAASPSSIEIPITGAYLDEDNNGKWVGIKAADLEKALGESDKADEIREAIKKDEDGVLWVNEERADFTEDQPPSTAP